MIIVLIIPITDYGAIIMAKLLREFTQLIWWIYYCSLFWSVLLQRIHHHHHQVVRPLCEHSCFHDLCHKVRSFAWWYAECRLRCKWLRSSLIVRFHVWWWRPLGHLQLELILLNCNIYNIFLILKAWYDLNCVESAINPLPTNQPLFDEYRLSCRRLPTPTQANQFGMWVCL